MNRHDPSTALSTPTRGGDALSPPPLTPWRYARGLAVITTVLTLWELIYPFNFQSTPVTPWLGEWRIPKLNTIGNILLFLPFGLLAGWSSHRDTPRKSAMVGWITLGGLLLSLCGETLQVWLPNRHSSGVDMLANTAGSAIGAGLGCAWRDPLTQRARKLEQWFADRPSARTAAWVIMAVLILRTAPFDISPETFYLRWSLHDTLEAGAPFSAVVAWYRDTTDDPQIRHLAIQQGQHAAVNLVLFAAAAAATGRAVRDSARRSGDYRYPLASVIVVGVGLVLATELLQGVIRSRLMDATDAAAGTIGVILAAVMDGTMNYIATRRHYG